LDPSQDLSGCPPDDGEGAEEIEQVAVIVSVVIERVEKEYDSDKVCVWCKVEGELERRGTAQARTPDHLCEGNEAQDQKYHCQPLPTAVLLLVHQHSKEHGGNHSARLKHDLQVMREQTGGAREVIAVLKPMKE